MKYLYLTKISPYPKANFQSIALLSLEGMSMKKIALELDSPAQTLCTFYKKHMRRFQPLFRAYLEN